MFSYQCTFTFSCVKIYLPFFFTSNLKIKKKYTYLTSVCIIFFMHLLLKVTGSNGIWCAGRTISYSVLYSFFLCFKCYVQRAARGECRLQLTVHNPCHNVCCSASGRCLWHCWRGREDAGNGRVSATLHLISPSQYCWRNYEKKDVMWKKNIKDVMWKKNNINNVIWWQFLPNLSQTPSKRLIIIIHKR